MKSKYKKVSFSLFAFGGTVRYMSLLHLPTNSYCVFCFVFLLLCSTIYIYTNNLVYIVNNKYNHQAP